MAAAAVLWRMGFAHQEAMLWVALLAAQAIAYVAALVCALIARAGFTQAAARPLELAPVIDIISPPIPARTIPALAADEGAAGVA